MKKTALIVILGLLLASLTVSPALAATNADLPQAFYGTVTINGSPAPLGSRVEARGNGVTAGTGNPLTTTAAGVYGGQDAFSPRLNVFGAITSGTPLSFYVNGAAANETANWQSGQVTSLNLTVNTAALTVVTGGPSNISTGTATTSGNLPQIAGMLSATVNFQWGLTATYGNETTAQTMTTSGNFTAVLSGLQPATIYHYRAKVTAGQNTVFGSDQLFTTSATGGGGVIIPTPTPTPTEGGGGTITPTPTPTQGGDRGTATPTPAGPGTVSTLPVTIAGNSSKGSIDNQGNVQETVKVASPDGKFKLTVSQGTKVADKDGKPLAGITSESVPKAQVPIPPQGQVIVGQPMQFGPDGATFNPPLELVMSYAGEALPAGVTDDRLIVTMWNGKTWEIIGGIVDPVSKTVTAAVSHFTMFALTTLPPPTTTEETPSAPAPQGPSARAVPSPTGAPVPAPSLATEPTSPTAQASGNAGSGTNWPLIGGLVVAIALVFLIMIFIGRRQGKR